MKKRVLIALVAILALALQYIPVVQAATVPYWIEVDKSTQRVTVYSTADDHVVYRFKCSTGINATSTPEKTFHLQDPKYTSDRTGLFLSSAGQYFRWCTRIDGAILFHTYLYNIKDDEASLDLQSVYDLGTAASHGCIRVSLEAARWIAQNCLTGTKVVIFTGDGTGATAEIGLPGEAKSVTVSHEGLYDITIGETIQASVETVPANKTGVWVTSNPAIASVSQTGLVTGRKDGQVEIAFVTENGKSDSFFVDVHDYSVIRSISIDEGPELQMVPGEVVQLNTTIVHEGIDTTLTWTTNNTAAAKVSSAGVVTAVADGTATITVKTANAKTAKITIRVVDPSIPRSVTLDEHDIIMNLGETKQLTYTILPATADPGVKWTVNTLSYLSVDQATGSFTANKEGTTNVTLRTLKGTCSDTTTIKVVDPKKPTAVTIEGEKKYSLPIGATLQLSCTVSPETAVTGLNWTSSYPSYASVDATGLVTAKAVGTTTIKVTTSSQSKTDSITVTVFDPTKATAIIPVIEDPLLMHTGETVTASYTLQPETATGSCTLTSSNANYLSVSGMTLTAVRGGTFTVTFKASSGVTAKTTVTVHNTVAKAEQSPSCGVEGYTAGRYCNTCEKYVSGHEVIPALAHDMRLSSLTPATGEQDGLLGAIRCTVCGDTLQASLPLYKHQVLTVPAVADLPEECFLGCAAVQVIIPEGTERIASRAFASCSALKVVLLPDSITSLADNAFDGCRNLIFVCSAANEEAIRFANAHGYIVYTK